MPPLLQLRDIRLTLGGAPLLDGAELSISAGDRIAVVGRNGSGKSTLFRIAAGQTNADRGSRFVQPRRASPICRRSRTCPASRPRSTMCSPGLAISTTPMRREP